MLIRSKSHARAINSVPKHILPFPSEQSVTVPDEGPDEIAERVDKALAQLDLRWSYRPARRQGVGLATKNVWSRAARRDKQHATKDGNEVGTEEQSQDSEAEEPALAFKLSFEQSESSSGTIVLFRWLAGQDTVLFESFCGMIRRILSQKEG